MFNTSRVMIAGAILAFACVATSASAAPLTWTLQNVVFTDGRSASGSFSYDEDTGTFSDFGITVEDGANLIPVNIRGGFIPGSVLDLFGPTGGTVGETFLQFAFESTLTNAGGTVAIGLFAPYQSFIASCGSTGTVSPPSCPLGSASFVVAGATVTTSPVPEPGTLALLGLGLAGLGLSRRRRAN